MKMRIVGKNVCRVILFRHMRALAQAGRWANWPASPKLEGIMNSRTQLLQAVTKGDETLVGSLLQADAEVDPRDEFGSTALMEACFCGKSSIVELLLEGGANPNASDMERRTPLHNAAVHGDPKVVGRLLAYGANLEALDVSGLSPLMEASYWGHAAVVKMLLQAGANPNLRDKLGKTALFWGGFRGSQARGGNPVGLRLIAGPGGLRRQYSAHLGRVSEDTMMWPGSWATKRMRTATGLLAALRCALV